MKSYIKLSAIFLVCCVASNAMAAKISDIIPVPQFEQKTEGEFHLTSATVLQSEEKNSIAVEFLQDYLLKATGVKLRKINEISENAIIFELNSSLEEKYGEEGYALNISKNRITITAAKDAGLFYGVQSLRQLLPSEFEQSDGYVVLDAKLSGINIIDKPRFKWRSFMLDDGRFFKGKHVVKKLLDQMALLKMNVFHWHLTEDMGWRIEIKKYPLLTEVGAFRKDSSAGAIMDFDSKEMIGEPHGGYYSQEDIKEIIAYATDLNIKIIPEIGMPGHVSAAVAAYPFLGTITKDKEVPTTMGVKDVILNIADPRVMDFIHDVLDEVMELFPENIIHIGGDEARYGDWGKSPEIAAYMKDHGIETPASLQVKFNNDISKFLEDKGHRMMGWTEILGIHLPRGENTDMEEASTELSKNAIVHFWLGSSEQMVEAAMGGNEIVNSTVDYTYLDYTYDRISLEKAYSFDPIPEGLDAKFHDQVIGTGAQMWGEFIPTVAIMENQVYPRIAATANSGWSLEAEKDYKHFLNGMENITQRWDVHNINYAEEEIK